jgi:hypothetical protein
LSSPLVIIYKTLILIKTWRPPLKTKLRPIEDEMINLMASNAQWEAVLSMLVAIELLLFFWSRCNLVVFVCVEVEFFFW